MPKSPKQPTPSIRNPNIDVTETEKQPQRRDRGTGDQELEDRVGRREDEKPEMVPPGTVIESDDDSDAETGPHEVDPEGGRGRVSRDSSMDLPGRRGSELDGEAIEADKATASRSDRRDGRDGVDSSDA